MNIIEKIKSLFSSEEKGSNMETESVEALSMSEREDKIYEKEQLSLQKLYEHWSCKDKWLLYEEGMPLLFSIDPNNKQALESEVREKIESLWQHAQDCAHKKLLPVINLDAPAPEWQVKPIDLYSWGTISRIEMPDEFSLLMTFVSQTMKPAAINTETRQNESPEDALYQKHREIVLGAATSLLMNAPDLCKNKKGKIVVNNIAKNIMGNEQQWFGEEKPLLSQSAMADLINEYLKLTKPAI